MALVAIVFFNLGASFHPSDGGHPAPERETRILVTDMAGQAYARWSMDNPDRRCPTYIDDLVKYAALDEPIDRWGTRLELVCAPQVGGIGVVSAGADRTFRTADDLYSWMSRP